MRVVIQKTKEASVTVNNNCIAKINNGLLVLVGIEDADTEEDIKWLSKKIVNLRIFEDKNGLMNNSVLQIDGDIIVVSQFTLFASTKKGNRPSYTQASKPDFAIPMYNKFISQIQTDLGKHVQTGKFGADMKVSLVNDGPITISIDSKNRT